MRVTFSIVPCSKCSKNAPCAIVDVGTQVSLCQDCSDDLMKALFRAHPFISQVVKASYPQRIIAFLEKCTCERVRRYSDCPVHGEAVKATLPTRVGGKHLMFPEPCYSCGKATYNLNLQCNECAGQPPSQGVQVPPAT